MLNSRSGLKLSTSNLPSKLTNNIQKSSEKKKISERGSSISQVDVSLNLRIEDLERMNEE